MPDPKLNLKLRNVSMSMNCLGGKNVFQKTVLSVELLINRFMPCNVKELWRKWNRGPMMVVDARDYSVLFDGLCTL